MDPYYLIIALTYLITGLAVAIVFYYGLGQPMLGGFFGGLVVGLVGAFIGGVLGSAVSRFEFLVIAESVDIVPPVVCATVCVWTFTRVSRHNFR